VTAAASRHDRQPASDGPRHHTDLLGRHRPGGPVRVETGPPQDLVHEPVAESGDRRLVEEHRLQRRPPPGQRGAQLPLGEREGVGPEPLHEPLQQHPPEPARVVQAKAPAVGQSDDPPIPHRVVGDRAVGQALDGCDLVDQQPTRHAEVDADGRTVRDDEEQLAAPVKRLDGATHHRGVDAVTDDQRVGPLHRGQGPPDQTAAGPSSRLDLQHFGHGGECGVSRAHPAHSSTDV